MVKVTTKDLKKLYDEMLEFVINKVIEYEDSQVVASTMVAHALKLYRSTLTDEEFKDMLKIVVKNAKKSLPYKIAKLH
jgi:predicted nucleic-acid-binding protein